MWPLWYDRMAHGHYADRVGLDELPHQRHRSHLKRPDGRVNAPLLLSLLPRQIYIPASQGRATRFSRLIELLAEECATDYPGKELIIQRMLEALLVEALRWQSIEGQGVITGLLNGMKDTSLTRALQAIHSDVRANWTVAGLASIAGMSRSAFSARFGETIGCAPIEYLAR